VGRFLETFEDKVALVTGGASGIGLATCKRLVDEGARVVLCDIDVARGRPAAESLGIDFAELDVSDPQAWRGVVDDVVSRHGALHLAHLNAGVVTYPATGEELMATFDIAELPDASYRRIMGANLDGVIFGARATLPAIEAAGGGALVATASTAGVLAFPPDPVYTATKHGVVGFIRAMAPWLEAKGIGCHAILPGVVDTGILAEGFADKARALGIGVIPPEEIAEGVVQAARDEGTGKLWLCLPGKPPHEYHFAPVEGLGIPDGL
jgi:NAD(P)-dependent dehydrogenase (short-subunit alcohol dehydrogenase family)